MARVLPDGLPPSARMRRAERRADAAAGRVARGSGLRPSTVADMRDFLLGARAQGRALQLRTQLPPLALALACFAASIGIASTLARSPAAETVSIVLYVASVWVLLFSPQPSRRVEVVACSAWIVFAAACGCAMTARQLPLSIGLVVKPCAEVDTCCGLVEIARHAELLAGDAPCWFLGWHLAWRFEFRAACVVPLAACVSASLVRFLLAARALKARVPRALLDTVWSTLGVTTCCLAVGELGSALAMLAAGVLRANVLEFALDCVRAVAFAGMAAFTWVRDVREVVHGWLASRGEGVSTVVGIATLIGSSPIDHMQSKALSTLRSVRMDLLRESDVASNAADPTLRALSQPAKFGEIDAFISHSWRSDGAAKWVLLQAYREEFKRGSGGREPTIWLDKACLSPDDLDTQLALLPVFVASCKSFVVVLMPSYLERLWCVVELFVWMHVGDPQATVLLCAGWPRAAAEADASPPSNGAAKHARATERRLDAEQRAFTRAAARVTSFRVEQAECNGWRTAERLLSMIGIGFGGLAAFDAVVRAMLRERLDASAEQLEHGMRRARRASERLSRTFKFGPMPAKKQKVGSAADAVNGSDAPTDVFAQVLELANALRQDMRGYTEGLTQCGGPIDRIDQRLRRMERAMNAEPTVACVTGGLVGGSTDAAHSAVGTAAVWRIRFVPDRERLLHDVEAQLLAHVIAALPTERDENAAARCCRRLRAAVSHKRDVLAKTSAAGAAGAAAPPPGAAAASGGGGKGAAKCGEGQKHAHGKRPAAKQRLKR